MSILISFTRLQHPCPEFDSRCELASTTALIHQKPDQDQQVEETKSGR